MKINLFVAAAFGSLVIGNASHAEIKCVVGHNRNEEVSPGFKFKDVPPPSRGDAAAKAKFAIVDGRRDRNGGGVDILQDDRIPTEADQPSQNFFFGAGTDGGRLLVDLDRAVEIKQVNTYSWHPDTRGPQVYRLFASQGTAADFNARPGKGTDPQKTGWKLIAAVDTRPKGGGSGGQYGVSISDSSGAIGKYRYLLFDISRTEGDDPFGNTFYSEIDVIDLQGPKVLPISVKEPDSKEPAPKEQAIEVIEVDGGKYRITIDTSETPDLTKWVQEELAPVVKEWYPKIIKLLPSEGFKAPGRVSIQFSKDMRGVAATGGTRIRCAASWYRRNLKGEARGSVVHELVHVVQQYRRVRRSNSGATRMPGWLVEGIADYIRWFLYEPETHGADITRRNLSRARYDGSYRVTGNFLNWVTGKYDKNIVQKLNAAAREGKYSVDLWKKNTGHTVEELGEEWKKTLEKKLQGEPGS